MVYKLCAPLPVEFLFYSLDLEELSDLPLELFVALELDELSGELEALAFSDLPLELSLPFELSLLSDLLSVESLLSLLVMRLAPDADL